MLATVDTALAADSSDRLWAQIARLQAQSPPPGADPLQRIGGSLVLHCNLDLAGGAVLDAASVGTEFRGYEALLPGRSLAEAGLISSTASGICGGVHAATSAQCLEMALGITPPPLAIVARNLLLGCQYLNDTAMHLFVLCGPDYAASVVQATNPEIWARARISPTSHGGIHGYATIGDILTDLERGSGKLFAEALDMMRVARAAYRLLGGKYPHSESICPGGVSFSLRPEQLDGLLQTLAPFIDYAKRAARLWDDIVDFFYGCDPAYRDLGRAPATMVDFGQWDHEDFYDASFENCDRWGESRWSTPGAVVDGKLVTTELSHLNAGLEEFVDHSFYDPWRDYPNPRDPLGNALPRQHPWNKLARRNAAKTGPRTAYSWATAIAWRRNVFEVGVYARLYVSALARKIPASEFVESTGHSLVFHLPAAQLLDDRLEWRVPPVWNAFERNRARAYALAFTLAVTLENTRRARALLARGAQQMKSSFEMPTAGARLGVGFGGAGRGLLGHWAVLEGGAIRNYQIAVPSRINGGPRTPWGELGPCERALRNTPILESNRSDPAGFHGIDLVRTVQSFDPCMPCQLHLIFSGTDFASTKEVNTDGLI